MMLEQERIELEAENDGYSNESQRALANSRLNRRHHNAMPEALRMAADGLFVVVEEVNVYCPATDALMWVDFYIRGAYGERKAAVLVASGLYEHADGVQLIDSAFFKPAAPVAPAAEDEENIPF